MPFEFLVKKCYNIRIKNKEGINRMAETSKKQFELNECVTYRKNGVCKIVDITEQNFAGQGKKYYYVLQSVYDANMKVFVPMGSDIETEISRVLTVDELHTVIEQSRNVEFEWIGDCKKRATFFDEIIRKRDKAQIIWIIKTVSSYKEKIEEQKKKMKATDLKYLKLAENIIFGEFSFVLDIPRDDVMAYIENYKK